MCRMTLILLPALTLAQPADPVAARLDAAQDAYREAMKVYREKGAAWLEAREKEARKAGDKRRVDAVKEQRTLFDRTDELPKGAEDLRQRATDARAKLVKVYEGAVKEWTKAGEDAKAAEAERDLAWVRIGVDPREPRKVWRHGEGFYRMIGKGRWQETHGGKVHPFQWIEVARTDSVVTLQATNGPHRYTLKLSSTAGENTCEPFEQLPTYRGGWVRD